ncbi:hypothetical protein ACH49_03180 [Streptomyces leeuwenhoekii]|uniref:Uncharacterized protein n=1 Tax=Streptomyces leeuwenhoekii TaxID=1437453 RepID=A0ABR5I4Z5_STRLW|nr:hypothetical protein ACH49_03180 [Streptomyces leeuwenhoekii]
MSTVRRRATPLLRRPSYATPAAVSRAERPGRAPAAPRSGHPPGRTAFATRPASRLRAPGSPAPGGRPGSRGTTCPAHRFRAAHPPAYGPPGPGGEPPRARRGGGRAEGARRRSSTPERHRLAPAPGRRGPPAASPWPLPARNRPSTAAPGPPGRDVTPIDATCTRH